MERFFRIDPTSLSGLTAEDREVVQRGVDTVVHYLNSHPELRWEAMQRGMADLGQLDAIISAASSVIGSVISAKKKPAAAPAPAAAAPKPAAGGSSLFSQWYVVVPAIGVGGLVLWKLLD